MENNLNLQWNCNNNNKTKSPYKKLLGSLMYIILLPATKIIYYLKLYAYIADQISKKCITSFLSQNSVFSPGRKSHTIRNTSMGREYKKPHKSSTSTDYQNQHFSLNLKAPIINGLVDLHLLLQVQKRVR